MILGFLMKKCYNSRHRPNTKNTKRKSGGARRSAGNRAGSSTGKSTQKSTSKRTSNQLGISNPSSAGKSTRKSTSERNSNQLDESMTEHIQYFKSVVVNDSNMPNMPIIIKSKLEATVTERKAMMKNKQMDLLENFPFFFTLPDLVNNYRSHQRG